MTYIVGFKQPGVNAIISDARVSWKGDHNQWEGKNTRLKTGLLFTGCIFGRLGNDECSRDFIVAFRRSVRESTDSIGGFWQKFQEFAKSYNYRKGSKNQFKLLLSCRATGQPKFHLFDSENGFSSEEIPHENYFLSFGSGKEILDPYLSQVCSARIKPLQEYLSGNLPKTISPWLVSPYFVSLWLSELSLTFESSELEKHQVGGVFHFIYQTEQTEATQTPAIYIFSMANRSAKSIYSWIYRVACVQGGLYVERHSPPDSRSKEVKVEVDAFFDDASRLDASKLDKESLHDQIIAELNSIPFYCFCGFGFTPPQDRKSFGFKIATKGKREDLFDESGTPNTTLRKMIVRNFEEPI